MSNFNNSIRVAQKYRTNELSHTPGGVTIAVILKSGFKKYYDRVKYPRAYADSIHGDDVAEIIILE